jgi:hypothetical protein
MNISQLIALLNSIDVGEIDTIRAKLGEAREGCLALSQAELVAKLEEAEEALGRFDLKTYRKRVETVVARLGHLR